jgi:hypothetical protein
LPYRHVCYNAFGGNYRPEIKILPFDYIAAPTFVVVDPDSTTIKHEALMTSDKSSGWRNQFYQWIPFSWTMRDDSIVMNDPEQQDESDDEGEGKDAIGSYDQVPELKNSYKNTQYNDNDDDDDDDDDDYDDDYDNDNYDDYNDDDDDDDDDDDADADDGAGDDIDNS